MGVNENLPFGYLFTVFPALIFGPADPKGKKAKNPTCIVRKDDTGMKKQL